MITVRTPTPLDHGDMARLLNEIIAEGGTTALTRPVTAEDLAEWMAFAPDKSAWHVALDAQEKVVGFQWIEPKAELPAEAIDIATFVQIGQTGLGIGSKLFEATKTAARALGCKWINANIRADNEGGLIYYQSRGFQDYGRLEGYELADGEIVDKRLKRYDL
ncbi:MAG: GNAT family N-acetyltransferase [Pseudomonadota bacterium]